GRLLAARAKRDGDEKSLKRRLRPLFSTMEINLVSDDRPYKDRRSKKKAGQNPPGLLRGAPARPKNKAGASGAGARHGGAEQGGGRGVAGCAPRLARPGPLPRR